MPELKYRILAVPSKSFHGYNYFVQRKVLAGDLRIFDSRWEDLKIWPDEDMAKAWFAAYKANGYKEAQKPGMPDPNLKPYTIELE